jgi:SAM-dependent methyltransferase
VASGVVPAAVRAAASVVEVELRRRVAGQSQVILQTRRPVGSLGMQPETAPVETGLSLAACAGTPAITQLSWTRDHDDWFHRHFDHAARTVSGYMLGDSPLLQGRILDVGCGDGITDLGLALHCEPQRLVGIDPFGAFRNLPQIMAENHIPADALPSCLEFAAEDGNQLPFADDSFDVVISWGSLEHIAGGHAPCLAQIRRVLRDGGLFFAHPGLYYSNYGHHLGEFSSEPFVHLRRSPEDLRQLVLSKEPQRIDRSGHVATSAEYWQWYLELNKITVSGFEQELRALGFEPWRVALRTEPLIEYTPEILHYPMQDLATLELYSSWWNRKPRR